MGYMCGVGTNRKLKKKVTIESYPGILFSSAVRGYFLLVTIDVVKMSFRQCQ